MSALTGQRVLVTRPRTQAVGFIAALEAAGAIPIVMPLIVIAPPEDPGPAEAALDRLERYDWIVCTSANGARAFGERWALRSRPFPSGPQIAVIGPRTAVAAREVGLPVHAQPREFRGAAVPSVMGDLCARSVLLPRSDIGSEETPASLAAAGAIVDDVVFYRTRPAVPDERAMRELRSGVDILTFMSPSAVESFVALFGEEATPLAARATVACIGPVTADAARALGFTVHIQPTTYTSEALMDALLAAR